MGANKSHRPEQFKLQEMFKVYAPNLHTQMEYPVHMGAQLLAVLDFADLDNKIAYRLSEGSHGGKRQGIKYETQKMWLETLGWTVEDVDRDSWSWFWLWE